MQKDNIKESNKMKKNSRIALKKRAYSISDNWRGNPNIKVKYYNEWADPDLLYDDYVFNYWDIEDALWEDFLEYNELDESDAYDGYDIKPEYEEMFDKHVQDFGHSYLDELIWSGAPKTWHTSKKNAKRKKASGDWAIFIGAVPAPVCGKWVPLPCDDSDIDEAIDYAFAEYEKYEGTTCDEYMIPDYEGEFGMSAREMEFADPYKLNEAITELDNSYLPGEVIDCLISYYGIFDAVDSIDDVFYVEGDTVSDLAYNYIEETGGVGELGQDTLERYFDYEAFGRDLAFDFIQGDGYFIHTAKKRGKYCAWGIKKNAKRAKARLNKKTAEMDDDSIMAIAILMDLARNESLSYADIALAQDILEKMRDNGLQDSDEYFELANAVFGMDPFEE